MARSRSKLPTKPEVEEGMVALIAPKGGVSFSPPDYEEIMVEDGVLIVPDELKAEAVAHGYTEFPEDEDED